VRYNIGETFDFIKLTSREIFVEGEHIAVANSFVVVNGFVVDN